MNKKTIYWIVGIILVLWVANAIFFKYAIGGFKNDEIKTLEIG